jgi:serine/threonine-protein kinase SRPK3
MALLYVPMQESLSKFQRRLPDARLPGYFLKPLMAMLLTGLDHLHSNCHIIHTGSPGPITTLL